MEREPLRAPVVSLPNLSCPLTANQVNAVRAGVGSAFIGGNAYLYHYFKKAWWSGERAPHFFFHADWDQEFRDQDKFGHLLGGYHLARVGYAGLRESCVSDKKAIWWSAAYAAAFQLQIEIFDGMYKKYGFSYADMIANTAGQALAVAQELNPRLRAIKPTFSYHDHLRPSSVPRLLGADILVLGRRGAAAAGRSKALLAVVHPRLGRTFGDGLDQSRDWVAAASEAEDRAVARFRS